MKNAAQVTQPVSRATPRFARTALLISVSVAQAYTAADPDIDTT